MSSFHFQGEKLLQLRSNNGLRQSDLAKMTGISSSYISAIEYERKTPSPQVVNKLAEIFQVPPLYFYATIDDAKALLPHLETEMIHFLESPENVEFLKIAMLAQSHKISPHIMTFLINTEIKRQDLKQIGKKAETIPP